MSLLGFFTHLIHVRRLHPEQNFGKLHAQLRLDSSLEMTSILRLQYWINTTSQYLVKK